MRKRASLTRILLLTTSVVLAVYHAVLLRVINNRMNLETERFGITPEGSLDLRLCIIHLAMMTVFTGFAVVCLFNFCRMRLLGFIGLSGVGLMYLWWFFEKYKFLQDTYGLTSSSPEYWKWLADMGYFRGGTAFEIPAILIAVLMFLSLWLLPRNRKA